MIVERIVLVCVAVLGLHRAGGVYSVDGVAGTDYEKYEELVRIPEGHFHFGDETIDGKDGLTPPLITFVGEFKINKYPVTNYSFRKFVREQKYKTTAEEYNWSFVFESDVPDEIKVEIKDSLPNAEWWIPVPRAYWRQPEGKGSSIEDRLNYPAVHVSYTDAEAYCTWRGLRLPTEEEWEYAARANLIRKAYPWGDKYKKNRMNIWQGKFPEENKALDGYKTLSPVDAFPPQNSNGLYDMLGNVWEWTSSVYNQKSSRKDIKYVLRGGSFVDSKTGSFNDKARNAVRMSNEPDAGSNNLGFRCVVPMDKHVKDEL